MWHQSRIFGEAVPHGCCKLCYVGHGCIGDSSFDFMTWSLLGLVEVGGKANGLIQSNCSVKAALNYHTSSATRFSGHVVITSAIHGNCGTVGKRDAADKSAKKQARHFPVPVWSVNPDRACSGSECLPRETCLVPALLGRKKSLLLVTYAVVKLLKT